MSMLITFSAGEEEALTQSRQAGCACAMSLYYLLGPMEMASSRYSGRQVKVQR
jgi:hypothetical protein